MAELKQARVLFMGDKMHELPMLERARYVFARPLICLPVWRPIALHL